MFKKYFQEALLVLVHAVARYDHKSIINEGFHRYLNKVQKINSDYRGKLCQWLKGVFFGLYAWNIVPVERTGIA